MMNEHQKYELAVRFVWGLVGVILGLLLGFLIGSGAYFWIALIVIAGIFSAAVVARIRKGPLASEGPDPSKGEVA